MAIIDQEYHKLLKKIRKQGIKYEDPNRKGIYRLQIPSYTIEHDFEDGFPIITTKKLYWKGVVGELLWFLKGDTNIKYLDDNKIFIWHKDAYNHYVKNGGKLPYESWKLALSCDLHGIYGDLGRVYGAQWRDWFEVLGWDDSIIGLDQISNLIKGLKDNPMGTKHMVTAWNPTELNDMALPPCHWSFEILVEPLHINDRIDIVKKNYYHLTHNELQFKVKEGIIDVPKYQFTLKWHQRSVDTFLGR